VTRAAVGLIILAAGFAFQVGLTLAGAAIVAAEKEPKND
jgi:hypothetical protein